jgi:hypothetical protein
MLCAHAHPITPAPGLAIALTAVLLLAKPTANGSGSAGSAFAYAEPGIAPDGREIAFSSGGDIWSAPAAGGDAHLLVAGPGTDRRPMFSPDGRELAFVSTRTGGGDIYVLTFATGPGDPGARGLAARRMVARRALALARPPTTSPR